MFVRETEKFPCKIAENPANLEWILGTESAFTTQSATLPTFYNPTVAQSERSIPVTIPPTPAQTRDRSLLL